MHAALRHLPLALGRVCAAEGDRLDVLREVDEVFVNAIKEWGLYDKIWQAFAVFLPVRSVGEAPPTAPRVARLSVSRIQHAG